MYNHPKQTVGFTLLELVVAISIGSILMAMAIPSFKDMMRNNRLTAYANELVTALNLARNEAVKRGVNVTVRKITTADNSLLPASVPQCATTGYWNTCGWMVFVDNNSNGTLETGETIIRAYPPLPAAYTLVSNGTITNYISYKPDGTNTTVGGSFAICDNSDGNNLPEPYTSKLIIINSVGRIRMGKDTNNDGIPEKDDNATPTALTSCTSP